MKDMKPLADLIRDQVNTWLREKPSPFGKTRWIEGAEGKAYIRYNSGLRRLDLASIELHSTLRRKGMSKQIVSLLCDTPVRTVLIEQIHVPAWAKKMGLLEFPGRRTVLTDVFGGQVFKVEYIRTTDE